MQHKIWTLNITFNLFLIICISVISPKYVNCLDLNLKGKHGEGYYLDVSIGNPAQNFKVIIDTGSSNFAIAAAENNITTSYYHAENSSTFQNLKKNVSSQYVQGRWNGSLGSDILNFPTLFLPLSVRTDISEIEKSEKFFINQSEWQGILGLGYSELSRPDKTVHSWIDALQKQGNYSSVSFSLELCGTRTIGNFNHFGNLQMFVNEEKPSLPSKRFTAPLVRPWYYQLTLIDIAVGGEKLNIGCRELNADKVVIDSGSTNLGLPQKILDKLKANFYNYTVKNKLVLLPAFWNTNETSCFDTPQKWNSILPNISLSIAHNETAYFSIKLPPSSYIKDVKNDQTEIHQPLQYCYKVAIEKSTTGVILGVITMEGFKIVFNHTAKEVTYAKSECGPQVFLEGLYTNEKANYLKICNHKKDPIHFWTFLKLYLIPLFIIIGIMVATALAQIAIWVFKNKLRKTSTSNVFLTLNRTELINEE